MKLMEVTEKKIGECTFYIKPFPAFVSSNISGEIATVIIPVLGALAPLMGGNGDDFDIGNVNVEDAIPAISNVLSDISGDKIEKLMKKLLINYKNISVECEATNGETKVLDYDLANEIFCMELENMYILCYEVIRLNYGGFFEKLGTRFGNLKGVPLKIIPSTKDSEN